MILFCPWCGIETDEHDRDAGVAAYGHWDGRCSDCQLQEVEE